MSQLLVILEHQLCQHGNLYALGLVSGEKSVWSVICHLALVPAIPLDLETPLDCRHVLLFYSSLEELETMLVLAKKLFCSAADLDS